jgi:repressor of nif and glnA expression
MSRETKKENTRQLILSLLSEKGEPLGSVQITQLLKDDGLEISERSVRIYLSQLDEEGLTVSNGKKGRRITDKGRNELKTALLMNRVGYMSTKIDTMTYKMNFDLALRRGTVVINTAIVGREVLLSRLGNICRVFEQGYAMGSLVSLLRSGDRIGEIQVPQGMVGLCTVCSVTLNGVLLKHGIPTRSIFSGLLELDDGVPTRFSELINYDGSSVDPLQLFIRSRQTDYMGAITNGNGRIGAGFREIPEDSYDLAVSLSEKLEGIGLGAFMKIGRPSRDVFNIPVSEGSCGVVVIGGLNPVAILEETGAEVRHTALSGLMEYNSLFPYKELRARL